MSNSSHGKQQPEQNIAGGFGKQQPISLIGSKKSEWSTYSPHQDDGVKTIGTNFWPRFYIVVLGMFLLQILIEKKVDFSDYIMNLVKSSNFGPKSLFQVANLEF